MTTMDVEDVMKSIRARYPRLKWTDAIKSDFVFRLSRLDITLEQAEAVVSEVAMTDVKGYPQPAAFLSRMKACVDPYRTQRGHAPAVPVKPDEGPLHPLGHWFRHYAKPENRRKLDPETLRAMEHHEQNKAARAQLLRAFARPASAGGPA